MENGNKKHSPAAEWLNVHLPSRRALALHIVPGYI